jgi:hypothetical protein
MTAKKRERRRPEKPLVKQAAEFVIHHLADKTAFHPFTGTDYDAWNAYVPLVRLWGRTRSDAVVSALHAVVMTAQHRNADVMAVFKKAIPCLLDWSDEPRLWSKIGPHLGGGDTFWPCRDGERVCHHTKSRVYSSGMDPDYRECLECGAIWKPAAGCDRRLVES